MDTCAPSHPPLPLRLPVPPLVPVFHHPSPPALCALAYVLMRVEKSNGDTHATAVRLSSNVRT